MYTTLSRDIRTAASSQNRTPLQDIVCHPDIQYTCAHNHTAAFTQYSTKQHTVHKITHSHKPHKITSTATQCIVTAFISEDKRCPTYSTRKPFNTQQSTQTTVYMFRNYHTLQLDDEKHRNMAIYSLVTMQRAGRQSYKSFVNLLNTITRHGRYLHENLAGLSTWECQDQQGSRQGPWWQWRRRRQSHWWAPSPAAAAASSVHINSLTQRH